MSNQESKEKCYCCNKEKEIVITVFGRGLCDDCIVQYNDARDMINSLRGSK